MNFLDSLSFFSSWGALESEKFRNLTIGSKVKDPEVAQLTRCLVVVFFSNSEFNFVRFGSIYFSQWSFSNSSLVFKASLICLN